MNTSQTISSLQPGQQARISGDSQCWVTVERSGDGMTLRFVRHTAHGFYVFRSVKF
jgi:hypothetical protein